jgi:hypothetical protein
VRLACRSHTAVVREDLTDVHNKTIVQSNEIMGDSAEELERISSVRSASIEEER